jgi:hypothetical protein
MIPMPVPLRVVLVLLLFSGQAVAAPPVHQTSEEPLLDWSAWNKYRSGVTHPAATFKPEDLTRARERLRRYSWAQDYLRGLEEAVKNSVPKLTPEYLQQMIPATTPGDTLFTPCPACREQGKPWHPHGQWRWSASAAEQLVCTQCGTTFPSAKYPEEIVLHAKYGKGQTFTYCGGEPFQIFSYRGRPSFSGNLRAQKVQYMTNLCRQLAEAYALSGKVEYARAARLLLLRFAEVYPRWLVHVGYGEYADLDPHLAALNINRLPEDELCPPPMKPDRRLHTGYWSAGRARGVGMEAGFVRQMLEAYEFTCEAAADGRPVYSADERLRIERDLLLESTVLLVADKGVNNKSVGNATAVALVGMALGHPPLVRFGLDVFRKTVDGWFLSDGGTSESWAYALMTLNGITPLGQALSGYSDPPGYRDPQGQRLDRLDVYHETAYGKVWEAMFQGLQGDLSYPPLADSSPGTHLGIPFAELMAVNYPEKPQYLALLKALAGADRSRTGRRTPRKTRPEGGTLGDNFWRNADRRTRLYSRLEEGGEKKIPPLLLADHCFPALRLGYLRSGADGRDSTLVLSASDWGNHHHVDSLNLYYWHQGQELLSDLGYLWDHPQSTMTRRTFAHNTVMIDGKEQRTRDRGGRFTLFAGRDSVRVMEAETSAYSQATLYRRTVAQVEHTAGRPYVVDLFRVAGGRKHEYVFHGPNKDLSIAGPRLRSIEPGKVTSSLPADFSNVRGSDAPGNWTLTWKLSGERRFQVIWQNQAEELSLIGDGWGQRDWHNRDVGATLPYVVRRCSAGQEPTVFLTVYEPVAASGPLVQDIRRLPVPQTLRTSVVLLAVRTAAGTDYLASCLAPKPVKLDTPDGPLELDGQLALISLQHGKLVLAVQFGGKSLRWQERE